MAIDTNDEILQDFLVEAGEILEQLGEQLIDLEQRPEDYDLLNAVFRGFHTIKGGAGFLAIDALVQVCHRSEDVFNVLRQGQRAVDAKLMDVVLQVVDVVNDMFAAVRDGEDPEPADQALLDTLRQLSIPENEEAEEEAEDEQEEEVVEEVATELESDAATAAAESDEITEEEFDALLDELHGKGKHGGVPAAEPKPAVAAPTDNDEITEDEFEALLDELHGKGKHSGVPKVEVAAKPEKKSAVVAEVKPEKADEPKKQAKKVMPKKAMPTKEAAADQAAKKPPVKAAESNIRVDTATLDKIMNMVGELVLVRNRMTNLKALINDERMATAVANLDLVTSDLQNSVMKTRMLPVKKVFGRFPRVVRDLARTLKKEIDLEMEGEETDLDKNLVEALADPMVHLVRNAVDHGIESPEEREKAGKSRKGLVVLSASQEGDHILLTISDDGKGMDADVLRTLAVERGMMDAEAAERLSDKDCYNLIFQPGFSTKKEISDVSGRGVGMDVVKTGIAKINGIVDIDSVLGKGSLITIKLPLTLAILPTLMVLLGEQPFALPLSSVVEIFDLDLSNSNVVDGQLTIMLREHALPLFYLRKWLVPGDSGQDTDSKGHVVVVNVGGMQAGLVVDHLVGQEEVVIKPLGAMLQGVDGMAGATITGDGKIALILDISGLLQKYAHRV